MKPFEKAKIVYRRSGVPVVAFSYNASGKPNDGRIGGTLTEKGLMRHIEKVEQAG
jgi:hypothetical protein